MIQAAKALVVNYCLLPIAYCLLPIALSSRVLELVRLQESTQEM
ncbi:hypothetical protein [Moorena producens]|nr:hypothetical protein [Moorena producens]